MSRASLVLPSTLEPAPSTYRFTQEMFIDPKLCPRGAVVTQEFLSSPPAVLLAFFPESAKADSSGAKCEPVTPTSRNRELGPPFLVAAGHLPVLASVSGFLHVQGELASAQGGSFFLVEVGRRAAKGTRNP